MLEDANYCTFARFIPFINKFCVVMSSSSPERECKCVQYFHSDRPYENMIEQTFS